MAIIGNQGSGGSTPPESTTPRVGTYQIPAGKFARVTVTDTSTTFTINAVVTITATLVSTTFSAPYNVYNTTRWTNTTPYTLVGNFTMPSGGSNLTYGVIDPSAGANSRTTHGSTGLEQTKTMLTAASANMGLWIPPGHVIRQFSNSATNLTGYLELQAWQPHFEKTFWVPELTNLNGTRYIVEEYITG